MRLFVPILLLLLTGCAAREAGTSTERERLDDINIDLPAPDV